MENNLKDKKNNFYVFILKNFVNFLSLKTTYPIIFFILLKNNFLKSIFSVLFFMYFWLIKILFFQTTLLFFVRILDTLTNLIFLLSFLITIFCFVGRSNSLIKNLIFFIMFVIWRFFRATNFILIFIFFELSILPIFLIINGWGYQVERINARFYLLLYTLFFSFPFLLSLIFIQIKYLRIKILFCLNFIKIKEITFLFSFFFILAFLVKCPIYFLHMWLPKAHVEAPVIGSVYLAGVLLKLGGFGIVRIFISFRFNFLRKIIFFILILGSLLRTILCFIQIDQKCIIAFSSIRHITIFVSCVFSNRFRRLIISSRIIFFHGLISRNLFFFSYLIYNLSINRLIFLNQGYKTLYKEFYILFLITICLNLRIPPFLRFFSEWLIFQNWLIISFLSLLRIFFIIFFGLLYRIFLLVNSFHGKSLNFLNNQRKIKYFIILFFFVFFRRFLVVERIFFFS